MNFEIPGRGGGDEKLRKVERAYRAEPTQENLQRYSRLLLRRGECDPNVIERVEQVREQLQADFDARFKHFGVAEKDRPLISVPEMPAGLTEAQLDQLEKQFGFSLQIQPSLEDLKGLKAPYAEAMYPETQDAVDTFAGLTSFRPGWWNQTPAGSQTTFGDNYLASIRWELKGQASRVVLVDSAISPRYNRGNQHYGSQAGDDPSKDKLLPFFHKAFNEQANRFDHVPKDIEEGVGEKDSLLKIMKEGLKEILGEINFEVVVIPAVLENQWLTFADNGKKSSQTDTWEWTSTPYLEGGEETSYRFVAGLSSSGGAAYLNESHHTDRDVGRGVRFAVVFPPQAGK